MKVGDVQHFLSHLGAFLTAHQGGKPAAEFEAFYAGLEPFREESLGAFAQFLRDAAEYRRTGVVSMPTGKKPRGQVEKKGAAAKEPLKKKDDVEAVEEAVACLRRLYENAAEPDLTHEAIEAEVARIDRTFDAEGLKAVARGFGVKSGLSGKAAAKAKILSRIAERKGRHERGEVISEIARTPAIPASPPSAEAEPDAVVMEEPAP